MIRFDRPAYKVTVRTVEYEYLSRGGMRKAKTNKTDSELEDFKQWLTKLPHAKILSIGEPWEQERIDL